MVQILILNKSYLLIEAMKKTIERNKDLKVLFYSTTGSEASQILELSNRQIDIVLIDTHFDSMEPEGLIYASYIRQYFPTVKILMFSFTQSGSYIYHMYEEGIQGFIFQPCGHDEIVAAIRTIQKGERYYQGEVKRLLERYKGYISCQVKEKLYISPMELKFIQNLALPQFNPPYFKKDKEKEISKNTIWKNITNKLGTDNPDTILEIAYHKGWIPYLS